MKDISIYFKAIASDSTNFISESIGEHTFIHSEGSFPELKKGNIAIIHCSEYRNDKKSSKENNASINVLSAFLDLHYGDTWDFQIVDLGEIVPGNTIEDSYYALRHACSELIKEGILPIIIGGSQDLTFAMYQAYQELEQMVNITSIDSKFDLGDPEESIHADGFISPILMHRPCYLFNATTIGVQAPYVKKSELDLYEKLYFDVCRLGEYNANFKVGEPLLRNTDLLSMDLSVIRHSDFQSEFNTPNGFYAEQMCQLAKYAGISDKLTSFGLFSHANQITTDQQKKLVAEIIWYFLDGFNQRKGDFPIGSKKDYTKFTVSLDEYKEVIVFFKSPKSNRWWMEVPYPNKGSNYERHHLVPCDYEDYEAAMKNEMPNLWWKTYQKLV
jgi:arginase family enzyme